MLSPLRSFHDVVIAGAGPVGLFLACELRLAGCSVMVLERANRPASPLKTLPFGLRGLTIPTMDALDRRDLLEPLQRRAVGLGVAAAPHWAAQPRRPAGHFAGIQFFHDRIGSAAWPYRPHGTTDMLAVAMQDIEDVLTARAEELGVAIHRDCAVDRLEQREDGVTVFAGSETFHAHWLVGCDGGRSAVRKLAGIPFTGTEPEFTGYSALVRFAKSDGLEPGRHHTATGMYTYAAPGTIAMVEYDGGVHHKAGGMTREHVEAVLRRVSALDLDVAALELATTWTDRAFLATDYRSGRVLLAGDAAHVHSPLGGQGLNLGLGDAMNLGWKLAAEVRGDAPVGLLDSYARERRPVAAEVLDWSRAQVALMRPDCGARALAAIVRDLMETREGATYFAGRVQGALMRYDLGDGHPLIGRSAPDLGLGGGNRLNEQLRNGRGLLLDLGPDAPLRKLAERWCGQIRYIAAQADDRLDLRALLVRPDGVVAWVLDDNVTEGDVTTAGARWMTDYPHNRASKVGERG